MNELIKRNNINDSNEDHKVFQFLGDFKAKKCLYCFQDEEKFLCQCKVCDFYFCNNFHRKTSHIIIHLKQCKHTKISLYPFDSELLCQECRNKDIFHLYFKGQDILCDKCLEDEEDKENFTKIIENKKINEKILMSPDIPPVANRFDSYSESLITRINIKINKLKEINLPKVSLNYSKKKKYCLLYETLIQNEKDEIEIENREDESFDFELKFFAEKTYITAELIKTNQKFQFYPRQLLIVAKANNENKFNLARVIEIDKNENKITLFFKDLDKVIKDGYYSIKEKESTASFDRIINGLNQFKQKLFDSMLKDIQLLIIGKEIKEGKDEISNKNNYLEQSQIPKKLNIPDLENIKLNKSQEEAIQNCFKNKLTLIKGPPGTGKSTVLAILAYHLVKMKKSRNDKILICAPSNRAVDNISFLLQKIKKIKFVRVLSMEREITEDVDITNSLNDLIKEEIEKDNQNNKKVKELFEKRQKYGFLKGEDINNYRKIISQYQNKILNPCDIVLSTINNSADERISNYNFPIVIIDEATQALEPDCLLPLYHKAEMVILIGDEKQLGPTVKSVDSSVTGISISLFERLIYYYEGSSFISLLKEQYRMHKFLYEFSNKHFYNNQMITNGEIKLDEYVMNNFPWPNKNIPSFFYNYVETELKENNSFYNDKEIYLIFGVVHKLMAAGVNAENIGIITPYNAQKYRLYDKFDNDKYIDLQIESVDGFQGMEKEYIIISTVRSNLSGNIGFVSSTKRLNVALTRAKKGLIIIGNSECLAHKAGIWRDLVNFYYSKGLIVKGRLSDLEKVKKDEIFVKEIESEEEDEKIIEKEEKHKKVKKSIVFDYLKDWGDNKNDNKNTKEGNDEPAPSIDKYSFLEDKEENVPKNNKKKKKNKNNNSSEDEDEEEKNKKSKNKKFKELKYKEEDEKDESEIKDKKGKNKKNKNTNNIQEDEKMKNNNKRKNKNQNSSSEEEKEKNKDKKKDKKKKK